MDRRTPVATVLTLALSLGVADAADPPPEVDAPPAEDAAGSPDEGNAMDSAHRALTRRTIALARWIDAFFEDDTYAEEEADARVSVRQSVSRRSSGPIAYRTRFSGNATLPNASRRFSIRVEGNEDRVEGDPADGALVDAVDEAVERPSVALEVRPRKDRDAYASFRVGVRADPAVYLGPRFRYRRPVGGEWIGRASLDVRWFTDDGWRPKAVVDFDRPLSSANLFRQRLRVEWREDRRETEGIRYLPTSSFTHTLSDVDALRYAWSATYQTRPRDEWTSTVLSVRYRRRFARDWLFLEIAPFLAFERRLNWRRDPGLEFAVEVVFEDESVSPRPARRPDG